MTIEERIVEIKKHASYMRHGMKSNNFIPSHLHTLGVKMRPVYAPIVERMLNAKSKEDLSKAYTDYIEVSMRVPGFSDYYIIGGIMDNESKNKEFNVSIDTIIYSYLTKFKSADSVNLDTKNPKGPDVKKSGPAKSDKVINEDKKSKSPTDDAKPNEPKKVVNTEQVSDVVNQQAAAAHSETGFNINSFIKHDQPTIQMPILNPANANIRQVMNAPTAPNNNEAAAEQQKKSDMLLPHQTCGLSDEEIIAENAKHYKNLTGMISAYALYDLMHSKLLVKKMKELNAKDRPNNPQLKQVPVTECTDEPNLIERYPLAFIMQCNDKGQVIVVLFNPNVELDSNNKPAYPIYVCKGKLIKPDGEKK
jgi:hypothetical protein